MAPIVSECGCGRTYTLAEYRELPLCGTTDYDEEPARLELRHCSCRSTIGIWTDREGEWIRD